MLDKKTALNTAERYAQAVKKEFTPVAVVLFGSYHDGEPHEDSDIDIGVVFNGFGGDWRKIASRLWNIAYDISWYIEPHLLDAVHDKSGFTRHVIKTGRII